MTSYNMMVASIIINTFRNEVGRWGGHDKPTPAGTPQKALLVEFRTTIDYDKEDGYRYIDLLLYADANYTGVYVRERWSVWSVQDETAVEKGKSEWQCLSYHDSCWTEGVEMFLYDFSPPNPKAPSGSARGIFGRRLLSIGGIGRWYQVVEADEQLLAELLAARRAKNES